MKSIPLRRLIAALVFSVAYSVTAFALAEPQTQYVALFTSKNYTELQTVAQKALAAEPANAEAHFYLGVSYFYQRQSDQAVPHLEKAVEYAPANSEYRRALGDAYGLLALRGSKLAAFGRARKCKAAYEKAIELDPKNVQARISLGMYYMQAPGIVGGSRKKAYEQLEEIEKLDPQIGWNMRVIAYFSEKKYQDIRMMLDERAAKMPNDYFILYQYGCLSAATGENVDDGIAKLLRCLEIKPASGMPGHAYVQLELGKNYERKGDKPAARAAYEAALSRAPHMKDASRALEKLK